MYAQGMDNILIHPKFHEIEATKDGGILILPATRNAKIKALGLVG